MRVLNLVNFELRNTLPEHSLLLVPLVPQQGLKALDRVYPLTRVRLDRVRTEP
jgi:hypothetical protein